jgi:hypothetical protein
MIARNPINNMARCIFKAALVAIVLSLSLTATAMKSLDDEQLSEVTGQALFVSDYVNGVGTNDGNPFNEFGFYRMGLDVELAMNANIDKLALGCGGVNNNLAGAPNCDIDFDYVRFMGRNGSAPGNPVTSDFTLTRPFVELAVKNDDTKTLREIAGIKIGSQKADGFVSIGRRYANGQINQEHGGTCGSGANAINCHSGINSLSGSLGIEMSASVPIRIQIGVPVFGACIPPICLRFDEIACFGNTAATNDSCTAGDRFDTQIRGTRMTAVGLQDVELELDGGLLSAIGINTAYADISESLRFIHGFALQDTSDFGLSFQRERVSYPTFNKSGYSDAANTGWWMNVPDVKVLNIQGAEVAFVNDIGSVASALGEGVNLTNIELNQTPAVNCYGSNRFC